MTQFINLTPHAINLANGEGEVVLTIEASGEVARVATKPGEKVGELNEVEGLPAPQDGTVYIVSGLVGGQVTGRDDVVVPGTGPQDNAIRNEKNHIVAVTRLNMAC